MAQTAYQPVQKGDEERPPRVSLKRRNSKPRSWTTLFIYVNLFLSLLWLAPIITLLYFNFSSYVIGASLWCPKGPCSFNPFLPDAFATANEYDHNAHNLLGGLQLVAKALEVWFVFVAAGLVYIIANEVAKRPAGLPLGLHCSHVEFSDLRMLLDREFWQAPQAVDANGEKTRKLNWILYVFVVFCAAMCILSNLMGPAVAVLVLPTLRQLPTPRVPERIFSQMDSGSPPAGNSTIPYCTQYDFDDPTDYTCAHYAYETALDSWIASGKAYDYQIPYVVSRWPNGTEPASDAFAASQALFAVSQEWAVSFAFNSSSKDNVFIAPNRQVLRNMTADLENFYETISGNRDDFSPEALQRNQDPVLKTLLGQNDNGFVPQGPDDTFEQLKDSLATSLQRNGPVVGANVNFYQASGWAVTRVDEEQLILCGQGWSPLSAADANWNGTKCLPVGQKWPKGRPLSLILDFSVVIPYLTVWDEQFNTTILDIGLFMYWSNEAAYFNATHGNELAKQLTDNGCLATNYVNSSDVLNVTQGANCDYESFFSQASPDTQYPYILDNVHTIVMQISGQSKNAFDRFVIEFSPNSSIADYTLDTSPFTNDIRLVEIVNSNTDPGEDQPIYIHPSWLAAMLGAFNNTDDTLLDSKNESLANVFVSSAAYDTSAMPSIAQIFFNLTASFDGSRDLFGQLNGGESRAHDLYRKLFSTTYLMVLHLCSIISFTSEPWSSAGAAAATDKSSILFRRATVSVWAYGIDSRSSVFGVVIALMGAVVVLVYFVLGVVLRTRVKGPTELLAAALAQNHKDADPYMEVDGDEDKIGRVRYTTARRGTDMSFEKVS